MVLVGAFVVDTETVLAGAIVVDTEGRAVVDCFGAAVVTDNPHSTSISMSTQLRCLSGSQSPLGPSKYATSDAQDSSATMQHITSPAGTWHSSDMSHGRSAKHMASYFSKPGQASPHSSIRFLVGPIVVSLMGAVVVRDSGAAVVVCPSKRGTTVVDGSSGGVAVVASSSFSSGEAVVIATASGGVANTTSSTISTPQTS
jgi:hypothetical protein